ncbi:hypothetical protein BV22DRAFT_1019743 [Leucogyrophana mollusca]|uniref:Uncharacterized protein n=1 Tax=Leucogyrophana mollusca TaxID=85980 RepID=A0ACB8B8L0_9AGAM|nr:hypothetical protein BV22DRAFT_1019743 [Leucogyrophana mollusca]
MESPSSQPPSQKPASRPRPKPKPAKPPSRIAAGNVTQKSVSSTLSTSVTPVAATDKGKGKRKADARSDTDVSITDESNPPAKRARNKGSVSSSHRPQKHDTFWILDGNAILEIGGVLFKLHRSRLVDQSLFFADLFEANLSDNDVIVEEDVSGTIYHLHNTTPRDFTALLMLDKNPFEYCFGAPPFYTIAAILRASTALRFPKYREFAIQYLERQWPSALSSLTAERQPHAVDVIILGRQQDVPRVLKRAFYELLRSSGFGLNDGEGDEEGEGASDLEMDRQDERRMIIAREHLHLAWTQATRRFDLSFKVPKCPSPEAKSAAWERCVIDSGLADEFMWDPLCGLQALMDIRWGKEEGWCKECVKMRKDAWAKTRASLWARMDMWMSLPRDV